jgi:hypothetical protein
VTESVDLRGPTLHPVATPVRVAPEQSDRGVGEVLVSAEDLQRRVRELGEQISRDYGGRPLLLVGVLKGAVFLRPTPLGSCGSSRISTRRSRDAMC